MPSEEPHHQGHDVQKHSVHTLVFRSLKRTHDMFVHDHASAPPGDAKADEVKSKCKSRDEYGPVQHLPPPVVGGGKDMSAPATDDSITYDPTTHQPGTDPGSTVSIQGVHPYPSAPGVPLTAADAQQQQGLALQKYVQPPTHNQPPPPTIPGQQPKSLIIHVSDGKSALVPRKAPTMPKPTWHPPWKLMRVISGHHGWVRCVAVEPGNQWFVTGSADRVIKIWDLASGTLKLSLTGHVSTVRGVQVSKRQPYLFSVGEDKMVKCWDLEQNKVVRHYHGHLSAIYCLDLHPTIDVLVTAGRDSSARLWDMRTKANVHTLVGHSNTVSDVRCQESDPQIITSSHDCTVRLWDIVAGKTRTTLTHHKKSVRALALHPTQFTFCSASPDNLKQWKFPDGNFIQNLSGHNAIINCLALNSDNVLISGGDNGSMHMWDWRTGYNFQRYQAPVQPGSIDSEAGVFAATFDRSGSRLLTAEADKSVKIYREDDTANEDTHPIHWKPEIMKRKRF